MKIAGLTVIISLISCSVFSQHYYNDLVATGEIAAKRAAYLQNGVRSVQSSSFDANNQPIEGFTCQQSVNADFTNISTVTTTSLSGTSENTSTFNRQGLLLQTVDTTDGNKTTVTYTYDANNKLTNLVSESVSPGQYYNKEEHIWTYNKSGRPEKMIKIKNNTDTTYVTFVIDDKGNIGEERSVHRGQVEPTFYYYYDDNNRLTDIVRYNAFAKKLLPDYIFEYDDKNRVKTMLVTTEGKTDYQKWYYNYNEKGLKTQDMCFSKTKVLIGKVEYRYQF